MQQMQNRVTLVGNLGSDVQLTTLSSGNKVARVSMATSEIYKDKEGNSATNTQWHNIVGWGAKAESMERFLSKGSHVIVHGRLIHRSFEDKEGNTRYIAEVLVTNFEALTKMAS